MVVEVFSGAVGRKSRWSVATGTSGYQIWVPPRPREVQRSQGLGGGGFDPLWEWERTSLPPSLAQACLYAPSPSYMPCYTLGTPNNDLSPRMVGLPPGTWDSLTNDLKHCMGLPPFTLGLPQCNLKFANGSPSLLTSRVSWVSLYAIWDSLARNQVLAWDSLVHDAGHPLHASADVRASRWTFLTPAPAAAARCPPSKAPAPA